MREYLYIAIAIIGTTSSQLLLKKGMVEVGQIPGQISSIFLFLAGALLNLKILLSFTSAFVAALAWMAALSRLPISFAYPFISFSFVLVALMAVVLFKEEVPVQRWLGITLIFLGIFFVSRS